MDRARRHLQRQLRRIEHKIGDANPELFARIKQERYANEADAAAHLFALPDYEAMEVYICPLCGYLHIGHRTPWK